MELRTYLSILGARKWTILVTLLITLVVVGVGTYLMTPVYEASTTLRVATAPRGGVDWVDYDLSYTDRLMNTYINVIKSPPVLTQLATRLDVENSPQVNAEVIVNTELMRIQVRDEDPVLAADAANGLAQILIERNAELPTEQATRTEWDDQLRELETELNDVRQEYEQVLAQSPADVERLDALTHSLDLKRGIYATLLENYNEFRVLEARQSNMLSVIEPATVPTEPASPNLPMNLALGFLLGVMGGVGLAFLFENLDTKFHTTAQVESLTHLSTLGSIPTARWHKRKHFMNGTSVEGEAFRQLRTNLLALAREKTLRSLIVTSAQPGEGKSTVVASLALSLSYTGLRVVVVDCDLRHPTLHQMFQVSNNVGLSTLLQKRLSARDVLQRSRIASVAVLASGPVATANGSLLGTRQITEKLQPHPAELLNTPHMASMLKELNARFDLVLLDTPPAHTVTDAAILAPMVDGVILVVSRRQARKEAVQAAYTQLRNVHANLIGIVMNQAAPASVYASYVNG